VKLYKPEEIVKKLLVPCVIAVLVLASAPGCKDSRNCSGLDRDACISKTGCQWAEDVKEGRTVSGRCEMITGQDRLEKERRKSALDPDFEKMKKQMLEAKKKK